MQGTLSLKKHFSEYVFLLIILFFVFILSYVFILKMMVNPWTDIAIHIGWANEYLEGDISSSYPGFYLTYGLFSKFLHFSDNHAAAMTMGLFSILTAVVVYYISGIFLNQDASMKIRCLIVLFMSFFGPLYLGGTNYYIGQGSFNTWHNPSNSSVKFLALICFFLFVYLFHMKQETSLKIFSMHLKRSHLNILLSVLTAVSLVFKPSFFQVFAPSLAVIFLLDYLLSKRKLSDYCIDACVFVPSVFVILYQVFATFGSEATGGMYIYFARGWSFHSDNIFRSIMTQATFPLLVCVFCEKNIVKNKMLLYAVIFYIVGIAEGLFLVESGVRVSHGNFLWGNNLGIGIVYLACIIVFVKYVQRNYNTKRGKAVTISGVGLLSVQFLLGLNYILKCIFIPLEYF